MLGVSSGNVSASHFQSEDTLPLAVVSVDEVGDVVRGSKNRSASGIDGINDKIIKMYNKKNPTSLSTLFNECLPTHGGISGLLENSKSGLDPEGGKGPAQR